jgi:hypothetical protein
MYEPYVAALSEFLALPLPSWVRDDDHLDNWQAAPWKVSSTRSDAPNHF